MSAIETLKDAAKVAAEKWKTLVADNKATIEAGERAKRVVDLAKSELDDLNEAIDMLEASAAIRKEGAF